MTSPYDVGEITVWTKEADPATGAFQWNAAWKIEKRLIPIRSRFGLSGSGEATFRLLRAYRNDGEGDIHDAGPPLGAYVAITPNTSPPDASDPSGTQAENALWWGYIKSRDLTCLAGDDVADEIGTVQASGLGDLLDRVALSGFRQQSAGSTSGEGVAMTCAPFANVSFGLGHVIGNRADQSIAQTIDGRNLALFVRDAGGMTPAATSPGDPASPATGFWTRQTLLDHILKWCRPPGIPEMSLNALVPEIITSDLAADERLSWNLDGLTLKGALDLLIPRSRGLVWSLWPRAGYWRVYVDSMANVSTAYLHANTLRTVDEADVDTADVQISEEIQYDSVVVRGARHVFGFTASIADANIEIGWTPAQETAYRAGASKNPDGTANAAYASMTSVQKLQANREIRQNGYADVFTRFLLKADGNGRLKHKGATSGTGSGTNVNACPGVTWDGTSVTVQVGSSDVTDQTPNLTMARVLRTIPWEEGRPSGSSGSSDLRGAEAKLRPRYKTAQVLRYISADTYKWSDLLTAGDSVPSPQVDVDDRAAGVRIAYTPPELLAKGHWETASPAPTTPYSVSPATDANATDYTKLVFTIAVEADQRVEVVKYATGFDATKVRRPLVLEDDRLQFWFMHAGTVIGVKPDRTPDRISVDTTVRNDYPAAEAWAQQVAAFALYQHSTASITFAHPDQKLLVAEVGELVSQLVERKADGTELTRRTISSTVESVERVYEADEGGKPRLIIHTMLPEIPARFGANSPSYGGPVSQSLRGTIAGAALTTQKRVSVIERDAQRTVVIPPKTQGSATNVDRLVIYGGNTLGDGGAGIAKVSTISNIPTAYDPSASPTCMSGIGYGAWYRNGSFQGWVLICNDGSLGTAVNADLIGDGTGSGDTDVCTLAGTKTVTVGGDPNTLATVYVPDIS